MHACRRRVSSSYDTVSIPADASRRKEAEHVRADVGPYVGQTLWGVEGRTFDPTLLPATLADEVESRCNRKLRVRAFERAARRDSVLFLTPAVSRQRCGWWDLSKTDKGVGWSACTHAIGGMRARSARRHESMHAWARAGSARHAWGGREQGLQTACHPCVLPTKTTQGKPANNPGKTPKKPSGLLRINPEGCLNKPSCAL